jgi:hypothetical protein
MDRDQKGFAIRMFHIRPMFPGRGLMRRNS